MKSHKVTKHQIVWTFFVETRKHMVMWPLRHAALTDNYRLQNYHENEALLLVKCIWRYVSNMLLIILALVWLKWTGSDEDLREKRFYIFIRSNLDRWPLDLKIAPVVQRCVSTELEVSMAFVTSRKSEERDGLTRLMRPPKEGRIIYTIRLLAVTLVIQVSSCTTVWNKFRFEKPN